MEVGVIVVCCEEVGEVGEVRWRRKKQEVRTRLRCSVTGAGSRVVNTDVTGAGSELDVSGSVFHEAVAIYGGGMPLGTEGVDNFPTVDDDWP